MSYDALFADLDDSRTRRSPPSPLSHEQQAALDSPVHDSAVICAGAGAGKTKLLVERAAKLVLSGVDPSTIAVVTFTRKAASEIEARLRTRFASSSRVPVCATVHGLALSRLRAQGHTVTIASEEHLFLQVQRLREHLPDEYLTWSDAELLLELNRSREEQNWSTTVGLLASQLSEYLAEQGLMDFTSLMAFAVSEVRPHFQYILVDEAQDLSRLQRDLILRFGKPDCRYWYIGDDDQSIYAFRGSQPGVMRELMNESEASFVLSMNFRSAKAVVAHANNVIRFNPDRVPIEWQAHRREEGRVEVVPYANGEQELNAVRTWLLQSKGRAVLARTQAVIAPLREEKLAAFSVHESKGLEWDEVWVMGCEAALFPHPLGLREEERRLFYVAMTRARDALIMSYADTRSARNPLAATRHPSPFLYETQTLERRS